MAEHVNVRQVLVRNTAWNYVGFAVNLATNLLLFPFIVSRLGDSATGIWLVLASITGYMGLLELGLVPALAQSVAASSGKGDREALNEAASTTLVLLCMLAAIPLLAVFGVPWLVRVFQVPAPMQGQAHTAFQVAIVGFAFRMPLATFQAILLGRQRQDRTNQLWILLIAAKFVGAVALLAAGFGLVAIVTMEAFMHLAAVFPQRRWVFAEVPELRLRFRLARLRCARALVAFGGTLLAVSLCALLVEQANRLIIATALPVAMVTYFSAGWKLYQFVYAIPTTLVQAVAPLAAHLHGRGDKLGLRTLFLRITKYTTAVAWPMVIALGLCAGFLLKVWMGHAFAVHYRVVQFLVVAFVVTSYNHVGYSALIGTKRIGPVLRRYQIPQAVLTFAMSIWLVNRLGIVGVAVATAIPAVLLEYVFLSYVLRELGLTWREFAQRVVVPTVVPAAVGFAPLGVVYAYSTPDSAALPAVAVLCGAAYALLFWRHSLTGPEREDALAHLPAVKRALERHWPPGPGRV